MGSLEEASKSGAEIPSQEGFGAFEITDSIQKTVYKQLLEINKEVADSYYGALFTVSLKDNPDRFKQAAHSLRMMNGLLTTDIELEDENKLDKDLASKLETKIDTLAKEKGSALDHGEIKEQLPELISGALAEIKIEKGRSFAKKLDKKLQSQDALGGAPKNFRKFLTDRLFDIQDWFISVAKKAGVTELEFKKKLSELEEILLIITASHFEVEKSIKQILDQDPSLKNLETLKNFLSRDFRSSEYFFENVSVKWLELLDKDSLFFSEPPENGTWPESQYLARIANEAPEKVMDIIEKIPVTSNLLIRENYIVSAKSINKGATASRIVKIIKDQKWFSGINNYRRFFGREVGPLLEHLFNIGEQSAALELLDITLKIAHTSEWKKIRNSDDAQPVIDEYAYEEIVTELCPKFIDSNSIEIITILCKKLSLAYYLEKKTSHYDKKDIREDYSFISISDLTNPEVSHGDIKKILARGITILLEKLSVGDPDVLRRTINVIDDSKFPQLIFRRIKYRIYKLKSDLFKDEIKQALIDPINYNYFDHLGNEFMDLFEQEFPNIDPESQSKIFAILDSKPEFVGSIKEEKDGEIEELLKGWKYRILYKIKKSLPPNELKWLTDLENKYKTPDYSNGISTTWVGPTSPKNIDDMKKMSLNDIVDFFVGWKPKDGFMEESAEGLGRIFGDVVKEDPNKYQGLAQTFIDKRIRFAYIYHLFAGIEHGLRNSKTFDWNNILDSGLSLIELSEESLSEFPRDKEREFDFDDVLKALVSLIGEGFVFNTNPIPFERKDDIFKIISFATNNLDPDPEYEKKYGGDNMDPVTMSINTVRGEAMHTLIKYALWISKNSAKPPLFEKDVQGLLDNHLDPSKDPSMAIRSVYGRYLPNLYYLSSQWVKNNLELIFPYKKNKDLWLSSFGAYLLGNMYMDMFELLFDQYKNALEYTSTKVEFGKRFDLGEKLAQHISWAVAFNVKGGKEIAEGIIKQSSKEIKEHFIWFIGANILKRKSEKDASNDPDPNNLKWLWEKVASLEPEVAENFGYWFFNSPFDDKFTINQFLTTLKVTEGKIDSDHRVIEKLKEFVDTYPEQVLLIMELLISGDINNWDTSSHIEDYRKMLESIKAKNKPNLNLIIKRIANTLGQKRYKGFEEFDV